MNLKNKRCCNKIHFLWFILLITSLSWGQNTFTIDFSDYSSPLNLTTVNNNISFICYKNNSITPPAYYSNQLRLYNGSQNGNSIQFNFNGITVTKIQIRTDNSSTGIGKYYVDGSSTAVPITQQSNTFTINNLQATTSFKFQNSNTGSSGHIRLVDVVITYTTTLSTPQLNVAPNTIDGFSYVEGNGPSIVQSFQISGSNLTGNTTIWVNPNWEISENENIFYPDLTLNSYTGSVKTIYTRLKSNLSTNNYLGNIIITSGNLTKTIPLSGNVIPPSPTVVSQQFCGIATVADLPQNSGNFNWYSSNTNSNSLDQNTTLSTGVYYVSTTINGIESERTAVMVTVTPTPNAPEVATQNFCNAATVSDLPNDNNTYKWYATATGGNALANTTALTTNTYYVSTTTNNCESNRTAVLVTINPIPNAPEVAAQTFCGTTTIADLPNNNNTYKWYTTATGGNALANTTALTTNTYYVSTTTNNCESNRTAVLVTINSIPNAPEVAVQNFCGTATVADLPNNNNTYKWYTTATGGNALANTTALTTNTYYVSTTTNNCESNRTAVLVTINSIPNAPEVAAQNFCNAATVADLPNNNNTYKWYTTATGGNALANTTALTTNTYYVSTTTNNCESNRTAVVVTVTPTPNAPEVAAHNFCGTATVADLPNNNNTYKWYTTATGGNALANTTSLTTNTYYVSTTTNNCESNRTAVLVTINSIPNAPEVAVQNFCNAATVADLPNNNNTYKWYTTATGGNALANTTALTTNTYYVSTTTNNCESNRTAVVVTVTPTPNAPEVEAQNFCNAATVGDLPNNNNTYKWYTTATDGNALANTTALTTNTYYVSTTTNNCESNKTAVLVTINPVPNAPEVAAQNFCGTPTVADLPNNNNTYKWYATATGGNALANTTALTTNTYYVSTTTNNCESNRTAVVVTVNPIPNAPEVTAQNFCNAATVGDLPNNNNTYKWYTTATGGNALANTTALTTNTYYVSTTTNNCESNRTAVLVTINPVPNAPEVAAQNFCGTATVADLPNNNNTYKWYATATGGNALANTTALTTNTYYVSTTTNNCESNRTAVLVTINSVPNAPEVAAQNFCGTPTVEDLPNNNNTYKWYATATDGNALANTTALTTNTYYVSTTTNNCESNRTAVVVIVTPTPNAPEVTAQNFCNAATIADLPNNNNTYKWYATATDGNALANTTALTTNTYYVSTTTNNCESNRTAVLVTINPVPNAPEVAAQNFCGTATVADLPNNNNTYKWYATATGGNALANTTALTTNTYYVSTTTNNCESNRTAVVVNVTNLPAVNVSSIQNFCSSANVSDLNANGIAGAEILWFNSNYSQTPLLPTTPLTNGTYYVSQRIGNCTSVRSSVIVRMASNLAPNISPFIFCDGAKVSDLVIFAPTGVTYKWYQTENSTTPLIGNTILTTGTYYVTKNQYGCESEKAAVQVVINDLPNMPTGESTQTYLEGAVINNLIVYPATAVWYISEENAANGINPLSPNMPLVQGNTYYAVNIGTNGCPSLPLAVTVTITLDNEIFNKEGLKYYPNPISDFLYVEYTEQIEFIRLYNNLGQLILSKSNDDNLLKLDFTSIPSGIYHLNIKTKQGETYIKVVRK